MIRINFLRQYGPNMARLEAWYRLCDDISKTIGGSLPNQARHGTLEKVVYPWNSKYAWSG